MTKQNESENSTPSECDIWQTCPGKTSRALSPEFADACAGSLTDQARVWGPHVERESITGVRAPAGSSGRTPGHRLRRRYPRKAESFFAFVQPEELANLSLKSVLFSKQRICRTFGGAWPPLVPWIRQCANLVKQSIKRTTAVWNVLPVSVVVAIIDVSFSSVWKSMSWLTLDRHAALSLV